MILPETIDQMEWSIGDHGFEMSLSAEVPSRIGNALPNITDAFLRKHNHNANKSQIGQFIQEDHEYSLWLNNLLR